MESTSIGLDIGSSAVRAAEVSIGREGPVLRRYAQVGIAPGAVVDGEVVNAAAVTSALRRLWTEGGFSSSKVVLGVSGHRVIVRQADVPALNEEDLRSALRFDAQELIPIPMENASFDFRVLDHGDGPGADGKSTMRILLVAAHRDMLRAHLEALKGAGLEVKAIEPTPLSLMRVIPPSGPGSNGGGGCDVLVAIGAELTTVAVRQGGVPRFIRSLAVGGAKLTAGIVSAIHVDATVAERIKREGASGDGTQMAQVERAITSELRDLAEEVRATVDFFAAQTDGAVIERMLLTGGASETQGLAEVLAGTSTLTIERIDPFGALRVDDLGLSPGDVNRARATAATAVGLALWPTEADGSRLTILPSDVAEARRNRRITMLAATGVVGLAGLLAVVGGAQYLQVHNAQDQVNAAKRQAGVLQGNVESLQAKTAVHGQMLARQGLVVTALTGDIDWVSVLNQLFKELPPGLSVTGVTGGRATGSGASSASTAPGVGTLSFSVTGSGGLPAAAAWLDALQRDPNLKGTWVAGVTVTGNSGTVNFTSNTNLTKHAQSTRAKAVQK
jgi:type IV pilus assembly protein PilM